MNGIIFSVFSFLLIGLATGLVLRAFRRHATNESHTSAQTQAWLRASLHQELDEASITGDLRPEDLPKAESDFSRMVEAYARLENTQKLLEPPHSRTRWMIPVMFFVVTASFYGIYGGWHYIFMGPLAAQRHDLRIVLRQYRHHLAHHPDDLRGWRAVARGYELLGKDHRAAAAYRHLVRHGGSGDPAVLADYAQVLILEAPNHLNAHEAALVNRALTLDPDQPKALWWGGLLALAVGHDRDRALRLWNRLLRNPALPSAVRHIVVSRVVALGGTPASAGPPRDQAQAGVQAWTIHVTDVFPPTPVMGHARLYVFLTDPLDLAQPPYYVRTVDHPVFPLTIRLTDHDSPMGPPSHLAHEVELIALLSRNGLANPEPGDLEGRRLYSRSYLSSTGQLTVQIDERLGGKPSPKQ